MTINRTFVFSVLTLALAFLLPSCKEAKKGPAEKAGKQFDKAIEKVKETLK